MCLDLISQNNVYAIKMIILKFCSKIVLFYRGLGYTIKVNISFVVGKGIDINRK